MRRRIALTLLVLVAMGSVVMAAFSGTIVEARTRHRHVGPLLVADVAGFTKIGFTDEHLVIVNVLPAERMYTQDEFDHEHPTVGELALHGDGSPMGSQGRHVEAHLYDRATGLPVAEPIPVLELIRHDTNEVVPIGSVLMQDVSIGAPDIHFGDNVQLPGGIAITVRVDLGDGKEVVVDGHLD